jgi:hypothetical protein
VDGTAAAITIRPEDVGLSSERLSRIREFVRDEVERRESPER